MLIKLEEKLLETCQVGSVGWSRVGVAPWIHPQLAVTVNGKVCSNISMVILGKVCHVESFHLGECTLPTIGVTAGVTRSSNLTEGTVEAVKKRRRKKLSTHAGDI